MPALTLSPVTVDEARAARARIAQAALRTPLVPLGADELRGDVWLKLENLQPIGSFKIRGASNAIALADPRQLANGVWTASAGNMAQGVAWQARRLGLRCRVVAPDHAPEAKLAALERLGAEVRTIPFEDWFGVLASREFEGMDGVFIHPVSDAAVMAGNATIALEILEDAPDVAAVVIPYGGGGLSCGMASIFRALAPQVRVFACEVESAAPFAASLAAGRPVKVEYRASFVDGIGSPFVLEEMWPLASRLLDRSLVTSLERVASAIRLLAERRHVIAEGAGAASLAAALEGGAGSGKIVCVISGGNLDRSKLLEILSGRVP